MSDKKITLRCERIQPGVPNVVNNRIYSQETLCQMAQQVQEKCESGTFLGRLDDSADLKTRLCDSSHIVRKVWIDVDGHLAATCEPLDTDKGRELIELIENFGVERLEIIPCGIGSLRDGVVGEDYRLGSLNIVQKLSQEDE